MTWWTKWVQTCFSFYFKVTKWLIHSYMDVLGWWFENKNNLSRTPNKDFSHSHYLGSSHMWQKKKKKKKYSFNGRFDMLSSIQLEKNHPGGLIIEGRIDKKTKFDYSLNFLGVFNWRKEKSLVSFWNFLEHLIDERHLT